MRNPLASLALAFGMAAGLLASPALATNMTIEVAGEANGTVVIDLFEDVAPRHIAQIAALAESGQYNGVYFHRVMKGFMAQTGDVENGRVGGNMRLAGTGSSNMPNIKAEFSDIPFDRGVVGMARKPDPDSANAQFFIMFDEGHFLNGQYTVIGRVVKGMEVVDQIKLGRGANGSVIGEPDRMEMVTIGD